MAGRSDTMENWDQAQLEEVVKKKQKGALPETDIVCWTSLWRRRGRRG
jgi:hypothetical protein